MAVYTNFAVCRQALGPVSIGSREDFLYHVKFAKLVKETTFKAVDGAVAFAFCQAKGLIDTERKCASCDSSYSLVVTHMASRAQTPSSTHNVLPRWMWRGPQGDESCEDCCDKRMSAAQGTILGSSPVSYWMKILDCVTMWCNDYPYRIINQELGFRLDGATPATDEWIPYFQKQASKFIQRKLMFADVCERIRESNRCTEEEVVVMKKKPSKGTTVMMQKKPSNATATPTHKKPAANKVLRRPTMFKRPAKSSLPAYRTNKLIVQADESYLNKKKRSMLSKVGRPQHDQLWIWGCIIQGHPGCFFFRILDHASDAFDGKPRGKAEMLVNLHYVGITREVIYVSDSWKGTIAAVKQYRIDKRWPASSLRHEICNHSQGEIVNRNGFTTNGIESRWSVLKRWIRKRYGGKLPAYKDRNAWRLLVEEFQYRKYLKHADDEDFRSDIDSFLSALRANRV